MSSDVLIANLALTKLGAARILLLTDDSHQARTAAALYAATRDAELRRHNWSFAIKRAQLMALVEPPEFGYALQYPMPEDCLKLVQVGEHIPLRGQRKPWVLEQKRILTDLQAPLRIRYIRRETDASAFDPLFVEVLACKLAFEMCETLTQSAGKKQSLAQEYEAAIAEAKRMDSIERLPDVLPDGSWLDARGYGSAGDWSQAPERWTATPSGVSV